MSPPPKIIVPQPVPRAALLGAGASVPQLRPSRPESDAIAPLVAGAVAAPDVADGGVWSFVVSPVVRQGAPPAASQPAEPQSALGESAGLRVALERAHRTLGGVRAALSSRDRELRRAKDECASYAQQVAELGSMISTLRGELEASSRRIEDMQVSLDFLEARRATAARRFHFFKGRSSRLQYENEGLRAELDGRAEELRFARAAGREAVEDAQAAYQGLARLRLESARALRRLRARVQELTEAHRARVPWGVYQRVLDRVRAYTALHGPLEDVPADPGAGSSVGGDDNDAAMEEDGEVMGAEVSGDADMEEVDD